jgi:predicted DNA-binding transcriptional regulator AlpA
MSQSRKDQPPVNATPKPDELVGTAGVAEMLAISDVRVRQLATDREDFPAPVGMLGRQKVWRRDDIARWATEANRSPGRRSDTTT